MFIQKRMYMYFNFIPFLLTFFYQTNNKIWPFSKNFTFEIRPDKRKMTYPRCRTWKFQGMILDKKYGQAGLLCCQFHSKNIAGCYLHYWEWWKPIFLEINQKFGLLRTCGQNPHQKCKSDATEDGASGKLASHQAKSNDTLRKRWKWNKKSQSIVARDQARIKTFWKWRKSTRSLDARQQETERKSIHPESEKGISSHVSEAVKDPTTRPLPSEVDSSVGFTPVPLDLSELCAEQSDQDLEFLRIHGLN